MFVSRIILIAETSEEIEAIKTIPLHSNVGICLSTRQVDRTAAISHAHDLKKICLQIEALLLVDDVEIAALINADGVCCAIDDDMHGRAKDVLGNDKLVGGTAHNIQDVAALYEEGIVDFIILESYRNDGTSENILGKQKTQSIMDDARIMGYDIPIILHGGIGSNNITEAMSTGVYGVMSRQLTDLDSFTKAITNYPIR